MGPAIEVSTDDGGTAEVQGYIACCTAELTLYLYFLEDVGTAPAASATAPTDDVPGSAAVFLPLSSMVTYLALLHQHEPVYVYVDPDAPQRSCLKTNRSALGREVS